MRHCKTTYFTDQKRGWQYSFYFYPWFKVYFPSFRIYHHTLPYPTPPPPKKKKKKERKKNRVQKRIKLNHNRNFGLIFYELGFKDFLTQEIFGLLLMIFTEMQPKSLSSIRTNLRKRFLSTKTYTAISRKVVGKKCARDNPERQYGI